MRCYGCFVVIDLRFSCLIVLMWLILYCGNDWSLGCCGGFCFADIIVDACCIMALLDAVVWWFWMRGCLVGCFMFGVIWYVNNVGLISFYDFIVLIY